MSYEKLLSYYERFDTPLSVILVSAEGNLSKALPYLSDKLNESDAPTALKSLPIVNPKAGDILKVDPSEMTPAEFLLYTLGKRLATDLKYVNFRTACLNRNDRALARGIAEVNRERVEILLKSEVKNYESLSNTIKEMDVYRFGSENDDPQIEMLKGLRSFKYRDIADKIFDNSKTNKPLSELPGFRSWIRDAALLCGGYGFNATNAALFVGENKKEGTVKGVTPENNSETTGLMRTLSLENRIPFRYCSVSDLSPFFNTLN